MSNSHIRWSDETQESRSRLKEIELKYYAALESIKNGQYTFYGKPLNLNNPKELVAFLYVYLKEMEAFHEPF